MQPLFDPVALVGGEGDFLGQLRPETFVAPAQLLGGTKWIHAMNEPLSRDVEELAGDVLLGHHDILVALAVAQLRVELAGFGVDHVCTQGSGIAAEQRVGKGAVTPEKAGDVEPDQQVHQAVEEAVAQRLISTRRPQNPAIGQREVEMPGDQDGVEPVVQRRPQECPFAASAAAGPAIGDQPGDLDHRNEQPVEFSEQPVLTLGQAAG